MMRHNRHKSFRIAFGLMSFLFTIGLNQKLNQMALQSEAPLLPQSQSRLNPLLFKTLSFGHLPIAIDWAFLLSLTDDSMAKVSKGEHPRLYYTLDLLTELDPLMFEAYQSGANLLAVVRGDSIGAKELLKKGCGFIKHELAQYPEEFKKRYWERAWNLYMILGFVYLFQLDDMPNAAEAFRESATFQNAPDFIFRLEKRLRRVGGEYEVGLRLLNFFIEGSKDSRVKKELEAKRLNLFISHYIFELNELFRNFLNAQSGYKNKERLSPQQMNSYWKAFQKSSKISSTDPWGGKLQLNSNGQVVSTTRHEAVFGLR